MLRLQFERGAEELSGMHNQEHTESADPLHSLGEKLFVPVRIRGLSNKRLC